MVLFTVTKGTVVHFLCSYQTTQLITFFLNPISAFMAEQ